jgi:translocation and assembly module TamB
MTVHSASGNKRSRRGSRWWRVGVYVFAGILTLLILVLALTQTDWFRNEIRKYVECVVNDALNAEVSIGGLNGSLLFSVRLENIAVTANGDSILTISSVSAEYSPWALLRGVLKVELLVVDSPRLWLRQDDEGAWNIAALTRQDSSVDATETSSDSSDDDGLPFDIAISRAEVRSGSAQLEGAEHPVPSRVADLNLRASARITDRSQQVTIADLRFHTENPDFELRHLTADISSDGATIVLSDLIITTGRNDFEGYIRYVPDDLRDSEAVISSDSLQLAEFGFLLPEQGAIVLPALSVDFVLRADTARISVSGHQERHSAHLDGRMWPVSVIGTDSTVSAVSYEAVLTTDDVNWNLWLAALTVDVVTPATVSLRGTGFDPDVAQARLDARLSRGAAAGYAWDTVTLAVEYERGDALVTSQLASSAGQVALDAAFTGLLATPAYDLTTELSKVDLSVLSGDSLLKSSISGSMSIRGSHFDADSINGRMTLSLTASSLGPDSVDTLFAQVIATPAHLEADTFFVQTTAAGVSGRGYYDVASREVACDASLTPLDLSAVAELAGFDSLSAEGGVSISVAGTLDSLWADAIFSLVAVQANDLSVDSVGGVLKAQLGDLALGELFVDMECRGVRYNEVLVDRISLTSAMVNDTVSVDLEASSGDSLALTVMADVVPGSATAVLMRDFGLDYFHQSWRLDGPPVTIEIDSAGVTVDSLVLRSQSPDSRATIALDGRYAILGSHDLRLMLSDLELGLLFALAEAAPAIDGRLSGRVDWSGPANDPDFDLDLRVIAMTAAEIAIDSLSLDAQHVADSVDFAARVYFAEFPPLSIVGYVPLTLADDRTGPIVATNQPLKVRAITERLPLRMLAASVPRMFDDLSGFAVCSVIVSNTLDQPHLSGRAGIFDAAMKIDRYGINYRDMQLRLSMDGQQISIDTLSARRETGTLSVTGRVRLSEQSPESGLEATSLSIRLAADRFYVSKHNHHEVQVSGQLDLVADADEAEYSGNLTVHRSRFYLPALMGQSGRAEPSPDDLPLLVRATRDRDTTAIEGGAMASTLQNDEKWALQATRLYGRLRGEATVSLPRNTWIRSPEMRIELSGKIDVVKQGPEPELFGTINTVRGHYELYGRRFIIREGEIAFQGGSEYNPALSIVAEYVFRNPQRLKQTLTLYVSGTAEQPALSFELDGAEIGEGDALAYILFGRSFDQLTRGQQGAVGDRTSGRELAQGVAAGLVADQLARTIGRELRLDVIDIRAKDDWAGAAFEVGKYLTNDLFVSYQRGFGSAEDNEFAPEIVTLEYELVRNIFLRLIEGASRESGFDVIFRLQR